MYFNVFPLSDHESNDQNLLSEPEPDQPNKP